jgi:molybdate transport system substrate-binding protein
MRGGGGAPRAAALVLALLAATACTSTTGTAGAGSTGAKASGAELVVLAAASLTEAFTEIGTRFEATHEGVTVRCSFGPSDGLAAQIEAGAPADVFASASETWMDDVVANGPGIARRSDFARNELLLITPRDDPAGISSVTDLGQPGVELVLAAKDVPAGTYARETLAKAGVADAAEANVVSNEEDVKAVVQKVVLGEADAGIVYRTDLTPGVATDVRAVEIPHELNVVASYPIGLVDGAAHADLASQFVDLVTSAVGQRILRRHAFLPAGA